MHKTLQIYGTNVLYFEQLRETLADLNNFWRATSQRNLS